MCEEKDCRVSESTNGTINDNTADSAGNRIVTEQSTAKYCDET
jgi:hypothetical protein